MVQEYLPEHPPAQWDNLHRAGLPDRRQVYPHCPPGFPRFPPESPVRLMLGFPRLFLPGFLRIMVRPLLPRFPPESPVHLLPGFLRLFPPGYRRMTAHRALPQQAPFQTGCLFPPLRQRIHPRAPVRVLLLFRQLRPVPFQAQQYPLQTHPWFAAASGSSSVPPSGGAGCPSQHIADS